MAGIQLSGLATGLDWKSLVDQLISVSATPKTRMAAEQASNSSRSSALTELSNLLKDLQSSLTTGFTAQSFQERVAEPASSTSTWKAASSAEGTVGTFSFSVTQTAAAARRLGASDVTAGISPTVDTSGLLISSMRTAQSVTAGEFSINGARIRGGISDSHRTDRRWEQHPIGSECGFQRERGRFDYQPEQYIGFLRDRSCRIVGHGGQYRHSGH